MGTSIGGTVGDKLSSMLPGSKVAAMDKEPVEGLVRSVADELEKGSGYRMARSVEDEPEKGSGY
jgi:hypothetical protein